MITTPFDLHISICKPRLRLRLGLAFRTGLLMVLLCLLVQPSEPFVFKPTTNSELSTAVNSWYFQMYRGELPKTVLALYGNISTWDTSDITDMYALFAGRC